MSERERIRAFNLSFGQLQVFFFCVCHLSLKMQFTKSHRMLVVCVWYGDWSMLKVLKRWILFHFNMKLFHYIAFVSLFNVHSQKHFRNFICTHTQKKPSPDTLSLCCCVSAYKIHLDEKEYRSSNIDFVAIQHCSKCKTAVCLAFGRQIQFVCYIFSGVVAVTVTVVIV